MNPDGTNSSTNTGAVGGSPATGMGATGAGSVVPPALDFTSSSPAEATSLSMADSLASAADNLTSAGMAAKEPDNGSIEMNEIGASDPSATMERPDEPLVPAAPVPGSIGSVTSGPAVANGDGAAAANSGFGGAATGVSSGVSGFGASAGASTAAGTSSFGAAGATSGFGTTGSTGSTAGSGASTAGFGAMPTTNNMGTGTGFGASAASSASSMGGASGMNGASGAATSEPYNPFAARMGNSGASSAGASASGTGSQPTSSMNVPTGSQPATEKFSKKSVVADGKKPSLLTVILGILAAVSLVMAIVFAILWQQAEANRDVVYVPSNPDNSGTVNQTISIISCARDFGADVADLVNLTNHSVSVTANFTDDQLSAVALTNRYTFADNESAQASQGYFGWMIDWYNGVAESAGVEAIGAEYGIIDATATFSLTANRDQLVGDYIATFGLPTNAEGGLDGSRESVQASYEANGYVCTED